MDSPCILLGSERERKRTRLAGSRARPGSEDRPPVPVLTPADGPKTGTGKRNVHALDKFVVRTETGGRFLTGNVHRAGKVVHALRLVADGDKRAVRFRDLVVILVPDGLLPRIVVEAMGERAERERADGDGFRKVRLTLGMEFGGDGVRDSAGPPLQGFCRHARSPPCYCGLFATIAFLRYIHSINQNHMSPACWQSPLAGFSFAILRDCRISQEGPMLIC